MSEIQKARVICGFPGVGKSYYHAVHPDTTLDSDSSQFSWKDGERNPDFPANYIKYIKSHLHEEIDICVSSHKEVRDALRAEGIDFIIVVPSPESKEWFLERLRKRGSTHAFVKLIEDNWDSWIQELQQCPETVMICESIHELVCGCKMHPGMPPAARKLIDAAIAVDEALVGDYDDILIQIKKEVSDNLSYRHIAVCIGLLQDILSDKD